MILWAFPLSGVYTSLKGRYATGSAYAPAASIALKVLQKLREFLENFTLSPVAAFGAFRSANARKGIVVAMRGSNHEKPGRPGRFPMIKA